MPDKLSKAEYEEYLQSEHWKSFARTVKSYRNFRCERCRIDSITAYQKYRQGLNVHHKHYMTLGREQAKDVEVLCHRCHMAEHGAIDWVDFCQTKAMPRIGPPEFICCLICGSRSKIRIFAVDEICDWVCEICR